VGQIFNIGGCVETTIQGLAEHILRVTGSASTFTFVPYETAYGPGFEDMQRRVPDISRISTLIEWQPSITLDETLMAICHYFRMLAGSDERERRAVKDFLQKVISPAEVLV